MTTELDAIAHASSRLLAVVDKLDDNAMLNDSSLPSWTVGNVLAHIALNAEAFVGVASDRRNGRTGVMYPHGVAGRNAGIAALGTESASVIAARLRASAEAFAAAWSEPVPNGPVCPAVGLPEFDTSEVLSRRLREVEVHGFDSGLRTLAMDGWTDYFVTTDLLAQWANLYRRTDESINVVDETGHAWSVGDATPAPITIDRRALLAWILDRHHIEALPTLESWGDQSRWSTPK